MHAWAKNQASWKDEISNQLIIFDLYINLTQKLNFFMHISMKLFHSGLSLIYRKFTQITYIHTYICISWYNFSSIYQSIHFPLKFDYTLIICSNSSISVFTQLFYFLLTEIVFLGNDSDLRLYILNISLFLSFIMTLCLL